MKYAVIVDGFSSGKLIFNQLQKRNIPCIHILTLEGKGVYKEAPAGYVVQIDYFDNNLQKVLSLLKPYDICYVFPGCEEGVAVAELLSDYLGLPGNNPKTTHYRRNKSVMQEVIQQHGLDPIKEELVVNIEQCTKAVENVGGFPVILKPLNDAGSTNVYVCQNFEQVKSKCNLMLSSLTSMQQPITCVLVQEMLYGQEFIVNSVTYNGTHFITDVWLYKKIYIIGGGVIATHVSLIDPDTVADLIQYTKKVLDALKIEFGAAHTEVMKNGTKFNLVESGARLMGGNITESNWEKMLTHNQIDALIACHLQPLLISKMEFRIKSYACLRLFPIFKAGVVIKIMDINILNAHINSIYEYTQFVVKGDTVQVTRDDAGPYFGKVFLMNQSLSKLNKDILIIDDFEKKLFQVE